uniref:Endonuclease/exonuclease/phosphatase domain-containing protein n=1 Tax=Octopus bimaculoides TaxID=37653 RepID=A0A0L8H0B0_OCTBM
MTIVLAFEEEVVRVICGYGPQNGRGIAEKERFFDEMANKCDLQKVNELVRGMGDFNGHFGKWILGFESVHGENGIEERNLEGRMLLEFCDEKELCVVNTWFRKTEKRKVTFSAGGNETDIDFVLVGRKNRKYLRDGKIIPGELQHRLVVADLDKKKVKKCVRKGMVERRKVWKLKEEATRAMFEKRERVGSW